MPTPVTTLRPVDLLDHLVPRWAAPGAAPSEPPPPVRGSGGRDARVAVVDAAADLTHPDLADADVEVWPVPRGLPAERPSPAATARLSVLAGQGRRDVLGLAPAAHVLHAPAVRESPQGADELVSRAIRWAVHEAADVVVLPFGRRRLGRKLATTVRWAVDAGVTVLAAAGDLGADVLAFPASASGALAVTAHDGRAVLPASARRADLAAPGDRVPVAGADGVHTLTGSAVAAVVAAGALATWVAGTRAGDGARTGTEHGRGEARERQRLVDL